ncbi:MAG: hypothetical protein ACPL5F_01445 [Moorellaceae bacterium]
MVVVVLSETSLPSGFGLWPGSDKLLVPRERIEEELERLQKARELARERRRTMYGQFFSDWNRLTGLSMSGAMDKPANEVSYSFLRDAYARSAIDQIIVNARLMQVRRVADRCEDPHTQVGFQVVHERHFDPDFKETEDIKRRCRECEEIILRPNPYIHPNGFRDFLICATEEELIIDRKVMIIFRDRAGRPAGYHLIPGDTVKPRITVLYPWLEGHLEEYNKDKGKRLTFEDLRYNPYATIEAMDWAALRASEDRVFNPAGVDLTQAAYVQEVDGKLVAGWREDEISVNITNPSIAINKLPYGGGSLFQKSLEITAAWINAWQYNQELFRTNYPESILLLFGDYDPVGLEAFKREMYGEAGQSSWQRLAVIPADPEFKAEVKKLRDTPRDMLFSDMLRFIILLKTACYRMNPTTINFSIDRGTGSYLFEASQGDIISQAQEEGFYSILENMADWLTRTLIKPRYPDLMLVWKGLEKEDEKQKVELLHKKATTWLTIDEARAAENLDPLPAGAGKLPANPTVLQAMQILATFAANAPQARGKEQEEEKREMNKSRKRLVIWKK